MFFRHFFFDFTANAPCFSTDFVRVFLILGIMKWLLFIFSFFLFYIFMKLLKTGIYYGPENMKRLNE